MESGGRSAWHRAKLPLRDFVGLHKAKPARDTEFFTKCTGGSAVTVFEAQQIGAAPPINPQLPRDLVDFPLQTGIELQATPPTAEPHGVYAEALLMALGRMYLLLPNSQRQEFLLRIQKAS